MDHERNNEEMVECHYNGAIIYVPVKLFLSVTMKIEFEDSKYIRFKDGPRMYNISKNTFMKLAEDAKAVHRFGKVAMVNVAEFDEYLDAYRE